MSCDCDFHCDCDYEWDGVPSPPPAEGTPERVIWEAARKAVVAQFNHDAAIYEHFSR
jgi:hypothetical protein